MAAASGDASGDANGEYQVLSLEDHIRKKSMWAGVKTRAELPGMLCRAPTGEVSRLASEQTPCLLKMFDEIIVNATDHAKAHGTKSRRVTYIRIAFDQRGVFSCENDGPGIPITKHPAASAERGREVYTPEVAFCIPLAGTNMDKPRDSIKGGVNGIGAKLANIHSASFVIETLSAKKLYVQVCRDQMRTVNPPTILKAAQIPEDRRHEHTAVKFLPAYDQLDYGAGPQDRDWHDLDGWLRMRACQAAAYVGPAVQVTYNGEPCTTTDAGLLAQALAPAFMKAGTPTGQAPFVLLQSPLRGSNEPYKKHPLDVACVLSPEIRRFEHASVINGVVTTGGGPQVTYIKKLLSDAADEQLKQARQDRKSTTTVREATSGMLLVVVGAIPGADWGGQRKDELMGSAASLGPGTKARPGAGYHFPAAFLRQAGAAIRDQVLLRDAPARPRRKEPEHAKYQRAYKAGGPEAARCSLLVAEGDSAVSIIKKGLTLGEPDTPTYKYHGRFTLGGVIMNAARKVTEAQTSSGAVVQTRARALEENKVLSVLMDILGLEYGCRYTTAAERARLRYGAIVACVDQDLDGCGKILGLLLTFFHLFWPALIEHGYVKRFLTPLIRVFRGRDVEAEPLQEFCYEEEFRHYIAGRPEGMRGITVKYYKGLAGHTDEDVARMFRRFPRSLYTFTLDDSSAELFRAYFGKEPALRKQALATPVAYLSYEAAQAVHRSRLISCSDHLRVETKAYKHEAIERQLPCYVDGLTPSRRKVLASMLQRVEARGNADCKVFQICGYVSDHMAYHHGDASMNATITGMAQRYPGANRYPYLVGVGQFGTRDEGGSDAGAPRYIGVRLATPYVKAMFPPTDARLLPRVHVDGEPAEPRYYVPVLPTILMESGGNPSEGWAYVCHGRRLDQIVAAVRAFIDGHPGLHAAVAAGQSSPALEAEFPLEVDHELYTGRVAPVQGVLHSFGAYHYEADRRTLVVTDLPCRVSTRSFLTKLEKPARRAYIERVDDESGKQGVRVNIRLLEGAYEKIQEKFGGNPEVDAVESFLLLRASLQPILNFVAPDGGVTEFGTSYHEVLLRYLPHRRDLYRHRLLWEQTHLRLLIEEQESILSYIPRAAAIDLAAAATRAEGEARLRAAGFVPLDSGLLHAPGCTPYGRMAEQVHAPPPAGNAGYSYILNLRALDLIAETVQARRQKLDLLRQRLGEVERLLTESPFAGASIWREDIDQVLKAIQRGEKDDWKFK